MSACCNIAVFNISEGCVEDEGAVIASSIPASESMLGITGKIECIADTSRGVFRVHHGGNTYADSGVSAIVTLSIQANEHSKL